MGKSFTKWRSYFMPLFLIVLLLLTACGGQPAGQGGASSRTGSGAEGSGTEAPKDKVRLGLSVANTFEFLPSYIAEDQGFFEKRNIDIEIIPLAGDSKMQEAMAAGSIDMAMTAVGPTAIAIQKGVPEVVVAALDNSIRYFVFVVRNDITDIDQLQGKVLGITSPNSSTDLAVRALIESQGWDEDAVTRLALGGFQEQMAAFKTGQTDGFVWTLDGAKTAEKEGLGRILLSADEVMKEYVFESIVANTELIEKNPDVVKRALEAIFEAVRYMKDNREYTIRMAEEKMKFDADVAGEVYDFVIPYMVDDGDWEDKNMEGVAKALVLQGAFDQPPSIDTFTTRQFVPVQP